ncbi:diguanylate cyclase domain-containing protein [Sphingomonas sp.]|uniref:GGDEF domain-containing protein n=1 Tax=Sphingomonas sp. TaxID=28214 RepID=UPI0035BC3987
MLILGAAWLLALAAPRAWGQAGSAGDAVAVCVKRAGARIDVRAEFVHGAAYDCTTPQTQFGAGDYLVLSRPLNTGAHWPILVRSASLWQARATLYALYADGRMATLPMGQHAASRGLQLGATFQQVLPVRGVPIVRLLWHVEGASNLRGVVLDPRVARPSEAAASNLVLAAVYSAFVGLCLALLLYNLALWGALRHRFLLHYCIMVTTLLVYAVSSSGALAWMAPIANNDRMRINYIALALSAVAALSFARSFFEARVFAGWLGRASIAVSAALILAAIALSTLQDVAPKVVNLAYAGSFLILILLVAPILWRAWTRESRYFQLFCIGWGAPVGFASLRIAATFGVVGWSFWLDNSTILAMTAEALLSSLAIAYRIRLLSRERDDAREGEIRARLLADTDPLTGMLNRRAFLAQVIGRDGEQVLLLADIDHFKRVNETIGHDGGDEVLRSIARALEAAIPPGALAARIGGEEFAIVAPASLRLDPNDILDRIRSARMPYDLAVTASIGGCTGPLARETDWKAMYRDADLALFAAKSAGRDRARRAPTLAVAA